MSMGWEDENGTFGHETYEQNSKKDKNSDDNFGFRDVMIIIAICLFIGMIAYILV